MPDSHDTHRLIGQLEGKIDSLVETSAKFQAADLSSHAEMIAEQKKHSADLEHHNNVVTGLLHTIEERWQRSNERHGRLWKVGGACVTFILGCLAYLAQLHYGGD